MMRFANTEAIVILPLPMSIVDNTGIRNAASAIGKKISEKHSGQITKIAYDSEEAARAIAMLIAAGLNSPVTIKGDCSLSIQKGFPECLPPLNDETSGLNALAVNTSYAALFRSQNVLCAKTIEELDKRAALQMIQILESQQADLVLTRRIVVDLLLEYFHSEPNIICFPSCALLLREEGGYKVEKARFF